MTALQTPTFWSAAESDAICRFGSSRSALGAGIACRFKERIKEITSSRRGVSMSRRLDELRRYAVGWLAEAAKPIGPERFRGWRMSGNSVVQCALTNAWLKEQGVLDMKAKWVALHYPDQQGV